MKQTAVEWLEEIINKNGLQMSDYLKFTFQQAKEMEKKQMIDFALEFANSDLVYIEYDCEDCPAELTILNPDRLFNETYGGNK